MSAVCVCGHERSAHEDSVHPFTGKATGKCEACDPCSSPEGVRRLEVGTYAAAMYQAAAHRFEEVRHP